MFGFIQQDIVIYFERIYDMGRLDYKSVKWNDKKLTRSTAFNHAKAFRPKAIYLWPGRHMEWHDLQLIYLDFPLFLLDHRSQLRDVDTM